MSLSGPDNCWRSQITVDALHKAIRVVVDHISCLAVNSALFTLDSVKAYLRPREVVLLRAR
jgi:hypothetical protein